MEPLRWARRIAVLLAVLALGLVLAPVAAAGGPTSVMIVEYPQGKATALRAESKEYQDLHRLLLAGAPLQGSAKPPPGLSENEPSLPMVRVTWFVHDVQAWRADEVYFGDAPKDVWVHSRADQPDATSASGAGTANSWLAAEGVWRQPTDGPEVRQFLRGLGLGVSLGDGMPATPVAPGSSATPSAPTLSTTFSEIVSSPAPGLGANWWWSLPGLVLGAAIALLLRSSLVPPLPVLLQKLQGRERPKE